MRPFQRGSGAECGGQGGGYNRVEGALIRIDRAIAYPIRDKIPVMLVPEGLAISKVDLVGAANA